MSTGEAGWTPARARLGRLVDARRRALGLNQRDVVPHSMTYKNVINGKPAKERTLKAAFRVLGWDPESLPDALRGGDPRLAPEPGERPEPGCHVFEDFGALLDGIAGMTPDERRIVAEILDHGRRRLLGRPQENNDGSQT